MDKVTIKVITHHLRRRNLFTRCCFICMVFLLTHTTLKSTASCWYGEIFHFMQGQWGYGQIPRSYPFLNAFLHLQRHEVKETYERIHKATWESDCTFTRLFTWVFKCCCRKELWDDIISFPFVKDGPGFSMLKEIRKESLAHLPLAFREF